MFDFFSNSARAGTRGGDIKNIFQIGGEVSGPSFIGRKEMVRELRDRVIYSGISCNLSYVGLPRVGKSSLVANALDPQLMKEAGIVFVSENVNKHESFEDLWHSIAARVWRQLKMLNVEDESITMAYEEYQAQVAVYSMIKEPLEFFFEAIKVAGVQIVLVLDEFDAAAQKFLGKRHYFEFIRDLASKTCYSISTITISRRQLLNIEADAYGNSTFQHIFDSIQVHGFSDDDMAEYRKIFEDMGKPLSVENLEKLNHYAGRSPFLLSIFGSALTDQIIAGKEPDVAAVYETKAVSIRNYFDSIVHQLDLDESLNKLLQLVIGPKYDLKASDLDWYLSAGYVDVAPNNTYYVISESCTRRLQELSVELPIWPIVMDTEKRLKRRLDKIMNEVLGDQWMFLCRQDEGLCKYVDFDGIDRLIRREWMFYRIQSDLLNAMSMGDVVKFLRHYWEAGAKYPFGGLGYDQWKEGFDLLQRARCALAHSHEDYLQESDIRDTEMFCRRLAEIID